jgi:hypothetical protein
MISANHDGKTEPASQATGWDFGLGNPAQLLTAWSTGRGHAGEEGGDEIICAAKCL